MVHNPPGKKKDSRGRGFEPPLPLRERVRVRGQRFRVNRIKKIVIQKRAFSKGLSNGFTLLEILVALAIMGIAVTYVIQLFSVNLVSISASGNYVNAAIKAETRMRQVLDDDQLKEQSVSEVTDDGYRIDLMVSDVLPDRTENLRVKLLEVDLTVHWQHGNREKALTLNSFKIVDKSESQLESLKEI